MILLNKKLAPSSCHSAFISDLDGTLIDSGDIDRQNKMVLRKLRDIGYLIIVATGRSYASIKRVLRPDWPIDFFIYSSGAAIARTSNLENLNYQAGFEKNDAKVVIDYLITNNHNVMVHPLAPNEHRFGYHNNMESLDFNQRIKLYQQSAFALKSKTWSDSAAQILSIFDHDPSNIISELRSNFPHLNIIRTTSPLNRRSTWIEIFPKDVSKAKSSQWLLEQLEIPIENTICFGNDYNDIELLSWGNRSYTTEDAPAELKRTYPTLSAPETPSLLRLIELEQITLSSKI